MNDEISAFVDGELDEESSARFMQRLKQDDGLMQAWREYHLIGDVLRGDVRAGLDASFARRLAAEPTVLAPRQVVTAANSRWMTALSAAAGVAAVAAAAWVALPDFGSDAQAPIAKLESASQATPLAAAPREGDRAAGAIRPVSVATEVPVAVGVEDYLLAHQRFTPASSMQGVAPYVRTVSAERKGDAR